MVLVEEQPLPDQGPLITFIHSPYKRSQIGRSEWPGIHSRSLHHAPSFGKLPVARNGMAGLGREPSKARHSKRAKDMSSAMPDLYKVSVLSKDTDWLDIESVF
jgi:hypothetical protein